MVVKQATMRTEKCQGKNCYQVRFLKFRVGNTWPHDRFGREDAVRLRDAFNDALDKAFGAFRDDY